MSLVPPDPNSIASAALKAIDTLSALPTQDQSELSAQEYNDESGRLQTWISEHDALSGRLDHKLREASHLRDRVLSLLQKLSNLTSDSIQADNSSEESRGNIGQAVIPDEDIAPDAFPQDANDSDDSDSLSLDTNIDLQDSELYSTQRQIKDVITLLLELGPALGDPAPLDRFERHPDIDAAQYDLRNDISYVRTAFPNAKENLVYRLGRANWERRRSLAATRLKLEPKSDELPQLERVKSDSDENPPDSSDLDTGSGSEESPRIQRLIINRKVEALFPSGSQTPALSASAGQTPAATNVPSEFAFSAVETQETEPTELSKSFHVENVSEDVRKRYRIPPPPLPNQQFTGVEIVCCFCAHKVSGVQSMHDWRKHVFEDLQPYMCTYAGCMLSAKTYGRKKLWWKHETERHRRRRSWICRQCERAGKISSFDTSAAFEEHIRDHDSSNLSPTQLQSIVEMCELYSESEAPANICPLCQKDIPYSGKAGTKMRAKAVKNHVSDHMEQLALFAAFPKGQFRPEEEDFGFQQDDSDAADGIQNATYEIQSLMPQDMHVSKQQLNLNVVNNFLEDQQRATTSPGPVQRPIVAKTASQSSSESGQEEFTPMNRTIAAGPTDFPMFIGMPPRSEHFYGREDLLAGMDHALLSPGSICYTYGVGGVGKTLSAVEYTYRHRHDYDALFWLQADTAPGLVDSYFEMALALGIVENPADYDHAVDGARDWLENTSKRWLVVFDNVIEWAHVSRYMPNDMQLTQGSVLILTQNTGLPLTSENVSKLRVEPLSQNDGAEMLLQYLRNDSPSKEDRKLAREISALCGGFPVAIAQAAGYVSYQQCNLEELFDTFREWRRRTGMATDEADDLPLAFREASFKYEDMLEMVWAVTLRELTQDARDVLNILAYLNSASVPQKMLWKVHEDPILQCIDNREKRRMNRIHESLTQRRLISVADDNYSMHRSLARGIRVSLAQDPIKQQKVFEQAVALIRETFPHADDLQQPRPDKWSEYQKLLPHLHALHDVYRSTRIKIRPGSTDFVQLLMDAGLDQYERMLHNEGLTLLSTAETALDASLDPQSEQFQVMKSGIHTLIALMYDDAGIGKRREALERRREALKLRRNMFDASSSKRRTDEILLFNSEMDYATSLLSYHRCEEAEFIIEKCLAKYREWGSEEEIPFEYAKYYHNIAFVKMHQRNFEEAIRMAEKGILLMELRRLPISANRNRAKLACIITQSGDLEKALHQLKEVHNSWMQSLGPTNQHCLYSMYAIGATNEMMGDLPKAEKWFRRTLQARRSTTSWPEEAYARVQFHLSRVLIAQGKVEEAGNLHDQALDVLQRLLPPSERPPELVGVMDDAILFDYMLPIGPRFNGRGLLERFIHNKA